VRRHGIRLKESRRGKIIRGGAWGPNKGEMDIKEANSVGAKTLNQTI